MLLFKLRIPLFWKLLACSLIFLGGPASADTIQDYLVQQVCDNGSGGHTNADPYTCPSTARKLQIGEALPYHKWDGTTAATAAQISDSYPIKDLFGRTRVVQMEYFDSQSSFVNPAFDAGYPGPPGLSGYDLLIADGSYVSAAGTYDPGAGWQPLWNTTGCSLSDSWIFAPKALSIPFGQGSQTSTLGTAPQCPPIGGVNTAYTVWNYYSGYNQYESGKPLNTVKSWHFAGNNVNATSLEVFYFTKQYGKTRWEAWDSTVGAADSNALNRCPTGTTGGSVTYGTTLYYLVDCHDWSNVVASPTGDWDPAANWHVDPLYNSFNLLKNTHMECTNAGGVPATCNGGGTCQTISPWNRLGTLNWGYDQTLQGPKATVNCALQISFPNPWNGESVYQDQNIGSGYSNYSFGAALWLPGAGSGTATAYVTVFQLNASGGIVSQHNVGPVTVTSRPKFFQGSFTKAAATTKIRFQIYPQTQNAIYEFTESWVAPIP